MHTERLVFIVENTKENIIDEAFKLFLTLSYEGVSISQLSCAIGMTKGALYHHFKNKEELFKLVIDKYLHIPTVAEDIETLNLYEYIQLSIVNAEKIIRSYFKDSDVFTPFNYMSLFADAFRHYPGFVEMKGKFTAEQIEKTKIVLQNAINSGEIRDDINVCLIASNFFAINMGLAGNLVRQDSIDEAISMLKEQNLEFYKLLKKK